MKLFLLAILGLLAIGLIIPSFAQTAPQTVTIDLSGTPNPNDFPYGIVCPANSDTCYISIHNQGIILAYNVTDGTITIITDSLETASAGKDFYAITTDGNGNLFVPERDNGEVKKYNIPTNDWDRIITMEEVPNNDPSDGLEDLSPLYNANVDYPNGYLINPNLIRINEPTHNFHTYQLSANSFGGITFTNGNVWQALNYNLNFDDFGNTVIPDVTFNGLVKIDPVNGNGTTGVSRIPLAGVTDVRGVVGDGTTLWITSQADDKLIKFDTVTETVIDSVTLASDSNPRGLSVDANFVYIALNKPCSGSCGNSEILRVDKTNLATQTIIDTTAPNTGGGTFTTFVFNEFLAWSDQSKHIGVVNLSNNNKQFWTVSESQSNYFMDMSGNKIIVAGEGSALLTTLDTDELSNGNQGGQSDLHLMSPTFGLNHINEKQFVFDGFEFNGKKVTITDNFHTDFEKQTVNVGSINTVSAKAFSHHGIKVMEFDFGVPEVGKAHETESKVEIFFDQQQNIINQQIIQEENLIDESSLFTFASKANCHATDKKGSCFKVTIQVKFLEQPFNEVMAIHAIDHRGLDQTTYLNEGIDVIGDSLNPPRIELMADGKNGLIPVIQLDKFENIWTTESGILYTKNNFGTWIRLTPIQASIIQDSDWNVDKRTASYWNDMIQYERERAKLIFNSEEIQAILPDFIPAPESSTNHREETLKKLGWIE